MAGRTVRRDHSRAAARRRRRMAQVVAAVVATLLIGIGAGTAAMVVSSNGADDDAARDPSAGDRAASSDHARELIRLLENQKTLTYHARYEAVGGDEGAKAFETWQTPSQVRQDTLLAARGQEVASITIIGPDQRVQCSSTSGAPWTCRPATDDDVVAADPVGVLRRLLDGAMVTARDDRRGEDATRCFSVTRGDEKLELCLLADRGIPTSIRGGAAQLELAALDGAVDPTVFEPPAPSTGR